MLSGLKSSANVVSCKFESSLTKPDFHHKKQVNRSLPISFRLRTSQSGPDAGASTTQREWSQTSRVECMQHAAD